MRRREETTVDHLPILLGAHRSPYGGRGPGAQPEDQGPVVGAEELLGAASQRLIAA